MDASPHDVCALPCMEQKKKESEREENILPHSLEGVGGLVKAELLQEHCRVET